MLLFSMSAATADRLLQAHRYIHPHGLATTKAGPLLKQQIPIRTFAQWDEKKPGFLEVDLVAHCGGRMQGNHLYTITLTDVATGWTECLPLLNRGKETVLAALQRARGSGEGEPQSDSQRERDLHLHSCVTRPGASDRPLSE